MIDILKIEDNALTTHELSVLFSNDVKSGKLTQQEILELQTFTLAMHQSYVKKIIQVFNLKPEQFSTTPTKFCNVFEQCQYLIQTKTSAKMEQFSSQGGEHVNLFNPKPKKILDKSFFL